MLLDFRRIRPRYLDRVLHGQKNRALLLAADNVEDGAQFSALADRSAHTGRGRNARGLSSNAKTQSTKRATLENEKTEISKTMARWNGRHSIQTRFFIGNVEHTSRFKISPL